MRSHKKKFEKPASMMNEPDSVSSESDLSAEEELQGGVTLTSLSLGEGATLYLQMMKTISCMFVVLAILNIPLYVLYENSTQSNNLGDLNSVFKYFTLGNLG